MKSEKKPCILIIDDNEIFLGILNKYFASQEIEVESAVNGQEGLQKYLEASSRYDAILLDIQMPIMNGHEVMKQIRRMEEGTDKKTPIIAISGSMNSTENYGFDVLLRKPFKIEELLLAVRSVL